MIKGGEPTRGGFTILTFGKYKGNTLKEVYMFDPLYVEWTFNNIKSDIIKDECEILLYPNNSTGIIEDKVREALMSRGYSITELNIFIRKLKKV